MVVVETEAVRVAVAERVVGAMEVGATVAVRAAVGWWRWRWW